MAAETVRGDRFYSWRNRIVFVSNVPFHYKAQDLLLMLRQFGRCFRVDLARNQDTGKSRGYAYVEFENQENARIAVEYLDNAEIDGRYIRAELAEFPPSELVDMCPSALTPDTRRPPGSAPRSTEAPPAPTRPPTRHPHRHRRRRRQRRLHQPRSRSQSGRQSRPT
jgi:RNA-binding motif X-linked protein 2